MLLSVFYFEIEIHRSDAGLALGADEALAETHAQTQEEDRRHAAHRQEDDDGRAHCGTKTRFMSESVT